MGRKNAQKANKKSPDFCALLRLFAAIPSVSFGWSVRRDRKHRVSAAAKLSRNDAVNVGPSLADVPLRDGKTRHGDKRQPYTNW